MLKSIKNFLIVVIVLGFIMAGLDYLRMNSGDTPIFNINSYNEKTKIQTYRGLFYIANRKVKASTNEPLVDSSNMEFKILFFDLNVPRNFKEEEKEFTLVTENIDNCKDSSLLYYADMDIKIYTYCLKSIKVKDKKTQDLSNYLKKDNKIIYDIENNLSYLGLYKDKTTLMFNSPDNFTNNGLTMYKCHKSDINDFYLAPENTDFKNDFCTKKDDDLKFIFKIEDKSNEKELKEEKEIFYEDDTYTYEFDKKKSEYITIIKPEVRGNKEAKYSLKEVLDKKLLTIDDLEKKGLKFNKTKKE